MKLSKFGLFLLLFCFYSLVQADQVIKNLKNRTYASQPTLAANIKMLREGAKKDEYRLGMVLYAAAQFYDEALYNKTLIQMQDQLELEKIDPAKNSYLTWRLGRMLMAADAMGDIVTKETTRIRLKELLSNKSTARDAYSAWAWGYLAALNDLEYAEAKHDMLTAAQDISLQAQENKSDHAKVSNAMYAWVMASVAAGNAKDRETLHYITEQMKILTGQKTVALALTTSLLRQFDSNDYPAWAISFVRLAAASAGDEKLFTELDQPLKISIEGAKKAMLTPNEKVKYTATAEDTLAELNDLLAILRMGKNLPQVMTVAK